LNQEIKVKTYHDWQNASDIEQWTTEHPIERIVLHDQILHWVTDIQIEKVKYKCADYRNNEPWMEILGGNHGFIVDNEEQAGEKSDT
jgi:hypothetical protein